MNWIDSIRTKEPVQTLGDDDLKVYGNDPVEIMRDWVTVAEDGYLTLRLRTLWGGNTVHVFNLVGGVNKENEYEFNLTHNANGDVRGRMGDALIAFDLNSIWKDKTDSVKIKVNWNSFSGKKSAEFSLLMHQNNPKMAVEPLSLNRCVNYFVNQCLDSCSVKRPMRSNCFGKRAMVIMPHWSGFTASMCAISLLCAPDTSTMTRI